MSPHKAFLIEPRCPHEPLWGDSMAGDTFGERTTRCEFCHTPTVEHRLVYGMYRMQMRHACPECAEKYGIADLDDPNITLGWK